MVRSLLKAIELVDGLVIVENKATHEIHPIHMTQLLTHMKLKDCKLGFLINWSVKLTRNEDVYGK